MTIDNCLFYHSSCSNKNVSCGWAKKELLPVQEKKEKSLNLYKTTSLGKGPFHDEQETSLEESHISQSTISGRK